MKCAVVSFPGSNGDMDAVYALSDVLGTSAERVWRTETDLSRFDAVVLPGGFSYGDYLRAGAIARFAPVMDAVAAFAAAGRPVLGICNGFQVLTEAGLLPGVLMRNAALQFRSRWVHIRVERTETAWTADIPLGTILRMPIAHGEGRYVVDAETLRRLEVERQIVFRYCTPSGATTPDADPNGATAHIAGVCNPAGNVVGLMPHPERGAEALIGGDDGVAILRSVLVASGVAR
ncbi:MAG TPA: phosphoribosylformylglycinamidine synthase subunit PurQ [Thermomicrobiales bacterium]|jgi:phosphoribosylformylglycinamidine synthase